MRVFKSRTLFVDVAVSEVSDPSFDLTLKSNAQVKEGKASTINKAIYFMVLISITDYLF